MADRIAPADLSLLFGPTDRALIARISIANDERTSETPSTPPDHRVARELERLASLVYEATSAEERMAEDEAQRKRREPHGDAGRG